MLAIDGVPRGRRRRIHLSFLDAAGAKTGKLFPTGTRA
jgi:2-methylaconitate cis-trans-isomerase PrpF